MPEAHLEAAAQALENGDRVRALDARAREILAAMAKLKRKIVPYVEPEDPS